MFKNKAMYVKMVDTRTMPPSTAVHETSETSVDEMISNIVSVQGREVVRGIVYVMGAYFLFSTVSTVVVNNTNPRK